MNWNLKELFDQVLQRHCKQQADLLKPSLISFMWKLFIAQYHADESKGLIRKLISHSSKEEYVEATKLILEQALGTDKGREFDLALFQAEAHMIAYAQSLHSLADILAQIIYYSLNLDKNLRKPIRERYRYLSTVNKAIKNIPQFNKLYLEVNSLLSSDKFSYLNSYVNTTKHRSLIPTTYSVDFVENIDPTHGLKIAEFKDNANLYKAKWAKEFIETDHQFIEEAFVNIGNKINLSVKVS